MHRRLYGAWLFGNNGAGHPPCEELLRRHRGAIPESLSAVQLVVVHRKLYPLH